jgi:transposase
VLQVTVPWAERGSRFTALFEALVIDWLREASESAVARQLHLSWDEVDGIMARAVRRGLQRREQAMPRRLGVDETSFQKRHEYVTVVSDVDKGVALHVADNRKQESLDAFFARLPPGVLSAIEVVCMDMWKPYIRSAIAHIPDALNKIAFDKFHVAKHLGDAVDKVRRQEHKLLRLDGDDRLTGTKYLWLENPEKMREERWLEFRSLRVSALKTARAWAIKEGSSGFRVGPRSREMPRQGRQRSAGRV